MAVMQVQGVDAPCPFQVYMLFTLPLCRDWEHLGDRHIPNINRAPLLLEIKIFECSRRGGADGRIRSRKEGEQIALLPGDQMFAIEELALGSVTHKQHDHDIR